MNDYVGMRFIGGHADGQYYHIHKNQEVVSMPEPIKVPSLVSSGCGEAVSLTGKLHHYTRQRLTAGDTIYYVMVYEGLQGDIVGALINGYKNESKEEAYKAEIGNLVNDLLDKSFATHDLYCGSSCGLIDGVPKCIPKSLMYQMSKG